ncbi:MAG TPA: hypothetical protein VMS88_07395, partial [Terriglobales bacterium]|nr:hypothetical protein [Terriglobales bacterium]
MRSPARDLLDRPPFELREEEKRTLLLPRLEALTRHHYAACPPYRNIVDRVFGGLAAVDFTRLEGLPFFPVSLFKARELKSVPDGEVIKVLTSSGTSGQQVSRVYVDAETSQVQSAVLVKVAQHFLGKERLPMIVLDHAGVLKDRSSYSARGAGILGMMQFGHRPFYALREDMSLDVDGLRAYLESARGRRLLLFGFTWMVWQYFAGALARERVTIDLSQATLVHSGGWKRLEDLAVSPDMFRARLRELTGIERAINFYGMVEQVGSVYFENERHHLHAPIFSEVIVRDPVSLAPLPDGETGLIQLVSCLPTSYPGHSLLTEDLGAIRGADLPGLSMK